MLSSAIILVSGCGPQASTRVESSQDVKPTIGKIHHGSSEFQPIQYNKKLGLLGTTPGVLPNEVPKGYPSFPQTNDNYQPGRVVVLKTNTYLPQMDPEFGYQPSYLYSSGNWLCWIYLSMGIGPDDGERVYAYNVSTKKEFQVWAPPKDSNEQLMEVHLLGNDLFLGLQGSSGNTVNTKVVEVKLDTKRQTVLFSEQGQQDHNVIEDFAVWNNKIALIYTPATHFMGESSLTSRGEPYSIVMYRLNGGKIRNLYSGYNINSFDFCSGKDGFIWSSKTSGVKYYDISKGEVLSVSRDSSYVYADDSVILWRGINDSKKGLFSTNTDKMIPFPVEERNSVPELLGDMIIFRHSGSKYDWAYIS
ncbi:hypothetical protein [Alicyclobacillus sacchari]|nr:hypothetical protein [Alicyclobacillus sacchari]